MYRYAITVIILAFDLWDLAAAQNDCRPRDCYDLECYKVSKSKDGPHTIYLDTPANLSLQVSCDQETEGGGWIMYLRRLDGTVHFTRNWDAYKHGFGQNGDNTTELWLGNENVYQLLRRFGTTELRIEVDAWDGIMAWIGANNVRMKNESSLYALDWDTTTASHQGMISNWEHQQNLGFQTIDAEKNECAKQWNGGWWYKKHTCARAYLTGEFFHENTTTFKGIYVDAFIWKQSLKRARMMFRSSTIRPCNNPCKNGGTCEHVTDPVGNHCACTSEWCGATCELKNPCENGGNCENVEDPPGHHCACTSGWCGATCEVTTPCENGGTLDLAAAQNDCRPRDCYDLECYKVSKSKDGPHTIYLDTPANLSLPVSCDQETEGGGWIMYLRRLDGTVNFTRNWDAYIHGFGQNGDNTTELWLGNENVYQLLRRFGTTELRIEVDAWDGIMAWIGANNVRMKNESSLYALDWDTTTASHQGMISNWEHHQNLGFQTIDAEKNECAKQWNGGWWYKKHTCARAYLTGEFFHENTTTFKGIYVDAFRWQQSLKRARMMFRSSTIRPCNNPCKNGGTCEHVADPVGHHCACTSEWCGATCELKNPCENGGNCETVEDPPGHHCACTSGWCGATCEVTTPCENGGTLDLAAAQNDCRPRDCYDLECYKVSKSKDGPHTIYLDTPANLSLPVSCDQETDGGGWIMYLRRLDGTVNFTRNWDAYKHGFGQNGDNTTELWLGNENVYQLLRRFGTTELRIEVDAWDGIKAWIGANNVRMKNESSLYALDWDTTTASHQGMISNWEHHQNLGFQTIDAEKNECAKQWNGGWWYKKHTCARAYLTGEFFHENTTTFKGIYVDAFRWQQSLKRARMMFRSSTIRPCNNPCKNGGTCEHVADPVGHHCACTSEWCGATCELKNPCENGGNCETVEDPPGHHCACTSGWCGAKCEVENPCENGGNCETVKDPPGHHCACTSGWC